MVAGVLDEDAAEPIVRRAAEAGVTFYGTVDVYSHGRSEEVTGRLLTKVFDRRDDYVLATKVNSPMGDGPNDRSLSRKHILAAVDDSLRRLGPLCADMGVGVIAWSPLARGWLAGTRERGGIRRTVRGRSDAFADQPYDESDFSVIDAVADLAKQRDRPPAQVALAWLLHKPAVTAPVIGATRPDHIDDAVVSLDVALTEADIDRVESPYRPHAVRGHV